MQEQVGDMNNDKDVSLDEASSSGDEVNMYQCSQAMLKTNIEKQPQKQNDRYNLRSKGLPLQLWKHNKI